MMIRRRLLNAFLALCFCLSVCQFLPVTTVKAATEKVKFANTAVVVTPSDSTNIQATRAIYVGVSGDVKVDMASAGTAIVFKAVPVGMLNVSAVRIYATGTTATNMVALY